jgi:hypothetical protein
VDRSNGGSEGPRQGFDGFDELLTTCAAVHRLFVVAGTELPKERNTESTHAAIDAPDRFKTEGEGEPMARCMHALKVGAWRNVCFLPLRGSTPKQAARFMNTMQEMESGNSSVPRWNLFSPDSVRVVSWNIDRDSKLRRGIEFLAGEKADMVWLQEADLNARDSSQQRRQGNRAEAGERTTFSAASFRKLPPGTKASAA